MPGPREGRRTAELAVALDVGDLVDLDSVSLNTGEVRGEPLLGPALDTLSAPVWRRFGNAR